MTSERLQAYTQPRGRAYPIRTECAPRLRGPRCVRAQAGDVANYKAPDRDLALAVRLLALVRYRATSLRSAPLRYVPSDRRARWQETSMDYRTDSIPMYVPTRSLRSDWHSPKRGQTLRRSRHTFVCRDAI